MPYAFFSHRNPWVIQNLQIQRWVDVSLNRVGNVRPDLPPPPRLHCFPCCLCSGLLISLSYSRVDFMKGRWPSAMWGIGPESVRTFGPASSVRPRASARSSPALPLTLIFWKWVCCHSNCQITSVMLPVTSQCLL